jgi:carboxymethylenebutenolidase
MHERQIDIDTNDGKMSTFVVHPERGGPFPLVLFYMDAPAIREELRDMARRIATVGYYVMLPNLYYRSGVMELGRIPVDPQAPERKRMMELMGSLTIAKVMSDTEAMLAFAAADKAASKGKAGAVGYCMSGQYAINAAAVYPDRVAAAASIYGVRLITDQPDSPHVVAKRAKGELYFACAETDHWMPLEQVEPLRHALKEAGVKAEVEVFPKTEHGFAFPARPVYDKPAAERHWERLFALFARNLG